MDRYKAENFLLLFKSLFKLKSIKTQLIVYLGVFALGVALKERDPFFLGGLAVAVFSAVLAETLILYFKTNKFAITESSIITGMIVGYVLSADELWWNAVAAIAAVSSKYIIVVNKKHVFNPAAFGIFLSVLAGGVSLQWKAAYTWYVLVPFGIYFARKINKTEVVAAYALVSLALFGSQAFFQGAPLWGIFGYFSYFYIFVMLIEPKTAPQKAAAKYIFGAASAVFIFVLTEAGARFDVELFSLLSMNATVPLLNKIPLNKRGAV